MMIGSYGPLVLAVSCRGNAVNADTGLRMQVERSAGNRRPIMPRKEW